VESGASLYQQAAQSFQQDFAGATRLDLPVEAPGREMLLAGLARKPPGLLVAVGTQAARAARQRLPTVPLLYCLALNPRLNGLVGESTGGVTLEIEPADQMAALQKALPRLQRLGVIYDEPGSGARVRQAEKSLRGRVRLVARSVSTPREAARAIPEILGQVDAFWMLWDPVIANPGNFKLLVDLSLKHRIALASPAVPFVEAGALLGLSADADAAGRRAAQMARQVLAGSKPGDFGAEPAPGPVITFNGQIARRLGVPIPRDLPAQVLSP